MLDRLILISVILVGCSFLVPAPAKVEQPSVEVQPKVVQPSVEAEPYWYTYDEALEVRPQRPVWWLFTDPDTCAPCQLIESRLDEVEIPRQYTCIKVTELSWMQRFGIREIPTSAFGYVDRESKFRMIPNLTQVTPTDPGTLTRLLQRNLSYIKKYNAPGCN